MDKLIQIIEVIDYLNKTSKPQILSSEDLCELQSITMGLENSQSKINKSLDKINQLKPIEEFNFEFSKTSASLYNSDLINEELAQIYLEYAQCIQMLMKVDDLICKLWSNYTIDYPRE